VQLLLIGLGGFAGAVARWLVDGWVSEWNPSAFPVGTLVVNLTGSFLLGVLFAWVIERNVLPADVRLESWRLVEDGAWVLATANLVGSVVLGLVAVVAGLAVGRALP
jgi:CrcB protein